MATLIDMPKLSDTMTVGTLVNWLKNEGDPVSNGDMIAEVETDKATMEVECFEDGVLLKQYCSAGDEVPVGGAIAAIGEAGEDAPEVDSTPAPEAAEEAAPAPAEPAPTTPAAAPTPVAPATPAPVTASGPVKASPLAKKIAADKGIDLAAIQGSGPGGRIVKADVLAAGNAPAAARPAAPAMEALSLPVSNMRKSIARALVGSKTQAPHFYLQMEVDGAPLAAFRKAINAKYADLPKEQGGIKFSVNDLTLKAAAEAVRRVPAINRSWEGETIQQHANVHLAFGVAIDDGLLTPVIRAAESKNLHQISAEAKTLIKKARDKKLAPDEMSGSTLTVTNLGMFGISDFYGIINPNNAAILSIGATIKKPVVNEFDQIVIGQTMKVGLSGDHRTIDGAVGAQYLQALKEILEAPALMLI
ncbi:MAG: dihydrolipoamide acetyltransferase [Puniceicoccaceae bacterium TMED149]|jgi:pyruvate dehydrogenase E2 component (dihydrolipoamide acetyltransferase)|nr:MAG: dihydrolipoamide acetyltransferase [Puniceicoccaceae bacterium TMED149]PDH30588.1 MAG: dihydrolipoamide acetyltransferase [Puniceicoccaceae bacterium MED-G30]RPG83469.1 MAG: 2-oxo acid dehydrogenase subunit E2 [Coraliomargarita sp. TMED73]RPG83769.1 MAG: 2-oxo acid dehydrogenase subunit E2 [Coraliomargarita sp. TMED73]|tara:strand:- start:7217 stop:8467 length:1251 start_codon:yes stop_codon:yes gene_type:complete